jgi:hypothetical protein
MASIAFSVPVKAGKTADAKKMAEIMSKEQSSGMDETRKSHGLKRLKVYHQAKPNEAIIVYLEADDIAAAMKSRAASDHEFEEWFGKMVEDITGYHPDQHFHAPPSELLLDWHESKGAKHRSEH